MDKWHVYFLDGSGCVITAPRVKIAGNTLDFYQQDSAHGQMEGHVATFNWNQVRCILREPIEWLD